MSTKLCLSINEIESLAKRYKVPAEDVFLIAINLYGIWSDHAKHRSRVKVRLVSAPGISWTVIVPLNAQCSPFRLVGDDLYLDEELVAQVDRIDADEAVSGYFRNDGRAATLNPNARSRCVGCAFCPNTLEAAADPRLCEERELAELCQALTEQHPRRDLRELQEVTVSTGCFGREYAAVTHLVELRTVLTSLGIDARIGFLSSVIQSDAAFTVLAQTASPFVLRLTAECFTRRDLMLKSSKARLECREIPNVLHRARRAGLDTSFTYIVGLDSLPDLRAGVAALAKHVSEFPNFQVYQAHNSIMAGLRAADAQHLEYYLRARADIEQILVGSRLRPQAWECYRPLWYYTFAGEPLVEAWR